MIVNYKFLVAVRYKQPTQIVWKLQIETPAKEE